MKRRLISSEKTVGCYEMVALVQKAVRNAKLNRLKAISELMELNGVDEKIFLLNFIPAER